MSILTSKSLSVLLVIARAITIGSAICANNSTVVTNDKITNTCSYPACSSISDEALFYTGDWNCVRDKSFCMPNQNFIPASIVVNSGQVCTCKDILDYPSLVGTCVTNGVYSAMSTADDCMNGTAVCEKDASDKFLGDTDHPFTACDLECTNDSDDMNYADDKKNDKEDMSDSLDTNDDKKNDKEDMNDSLDANETSNEVKEIEGLSGGIVAGIVIGSAIGFVVLIAQGKKLYESRPRYNKPEFFPVEGDFI